VARERVVMTSFEYAGLKVSASWHIDCTLMEEETGGRKQPFAVWARCLSKGFVVCLNIGIRGKAGQNIGAKGFHVK
jgi:hypothetical protein